MEDAIHKEIRVTTSQMDVDTSGLSNRHTSTVQWDDGSDDAQIGHTSHDQKDMQRMGKKQEFSRNFKLITTIGFTSCVMGTWEILITSNTQALLAAGLPGLFWSMCWCYIGQFFVVLSLAEMSSMAPTAGGQYHWVSEFAPRQYQKVLSYVSGWFATICWQSIVAVDCSLVGLIVQGLITMNDDAYSPTRWQGTLFIVASAILIGLFNVFGAKHLPLAEGFFVTCHLFALVPIVVVLLVLAPKQSASAVFLDFKDYGSGWPSMVTGVLIGQVNALFIVLGSDSVAHMAEEIENASIIVPKSMVWTFLLNIPFTFAALLTYLFCIGDVEEALSSPTGFPFMYALQNATQSVGAATGLSVVILFLIIFITISSLASTSRQTFAFARDQGLPFSRWIGHVHERWHIPVNSVIVTCLFTIVLSLINIGSTVAFNALLSLSTIALMSTYILSIGCVTLKRLSNEPMPPARWTLGRWGMPVNIVALCYTLWGFFWSFWPNAYNPTPQSMNWACVMFGGLMIISATLYLTGAKNVYEGPVSKVEGRKFN